MPLKVMLVEDNLSLLSLLETYLTLEGLRVVRGPLDAQALLETLRRERPQVLVMDVHLGGERNGMALLQAIRRDPDLSAIAIILTSGSDYRDEALEAGADGFLVKPFMPDELMGLIRTLGAFSPPKE